MGVFLAIIFGFVAGFFFVFSLVFLIYSWRLNKSNNFGDKNFIRPLAKEIGFDSELHLTSQADRIQDNPQVRLQHVEYGMQMLINSPEYKELMERSVKSPDNEQVATRGR
ncbi:MAG: hypothetical protein IKX04_01240 [Clostridiales bacterium]|nr:hypothetical protein [Clostridiales bacterium]